MPRLNMGTLWFGKEFAKEGICSVKQFASKWGMGPPSMYEKTLGFHSFSHSSLSQEMKISVGKVGFLI